MMVICANTCGQYNTVTVDTRYICITVSTVTTKNIFDHTIPFKGKEYVLPNLPDAPLFRTKGMTLHAYSAPNKNDYAFCYSCLSHSWFRHRTACH